MSFVVVIFRTDFSVEFKTTASKGTIFYVAKESSDFLGLYLQDGLLKMGFNCGSGIGRASTVAAYNDNQWHKVYIYIYTYLTFFE